MRLFIEPGQYVIAVSGGVDSMALLHIFNDMDGVELTVAHFDHGIRPDSKLDQQLVQSTAEKYGLTYEYSEGDLGPEVSEATARKARYDFLKSVQIKHGASAIITAHHQDDVLETAILNLSRGTGWRGLVSLSDSESIKRPLLNIPKEDILAYAMQNNLKWREDTTNADEKFLRNYIRHTVMPQFGLPDKIKLIQIIAKLRVTGSEIDKMLSTFLQDTVQDYELDRIELKALPTEIMHEILIAWWRQNGFYGYESKTLKRAVKNITANKSGTIVPLKGNLEMRVNRTKLALIQRER